MILLPNLETLKDTYFSHHLIENGDKRYVGGILDELIDSLIPYRHSRPSEAQIARLLRRGRDAAIHAGYPIFDVDRIALFLIQTMFIFRSQEGIMNTISHYYEFPPENEDLPLLENR